MIISSTAITEVRPDGDVNRRIADQAPFVFELCEIDPTAKIVDDRAIENLIGLLRSLQASSGGNLLPQSWFSQVA